jgi:hypothetical protein
MIVLQNPHMIAFCSWLFKLYLIIYLIQFKKIIYFIKIYFITK